MSGRRQVCAGVSSIFGALISVLVLANSLAAQTPQRIDVTVELGDAGGWHAVDPATVFAPGDRLRFRVSTTFAGFLYVVNFGTSGSYDLLFPNSDTGSDNRIAAAKDFMVPGTQGAFRVGGPPGHDTIYWLVSPVEFGRQYQPLPSPPVPGTLPPSFRPRCDDELLKARGDCVDTTAGLKAVKPGERLPENMNGLANATSRDLIFTKEQGQTVVSSPTPLSGPVIYELILAHR